MIISSESWSEAYLDTSDAENGTQTLFIEQMTELAHSYGKPVIVISAALPYDLAAYTSADALIAAYSSKKMSVIPEEYNGEMTAYGPNYPTAVMMIFGAFEPSGRLPVDIFKLDRDNKFTDEVLFPLGFGMDYDEPADVDNDYDDDTENETAIAEVTEDAPANDTHAKTAELPAETAAPDETTPVPYTGNMPVSATAAAALAGAVGIAVFGKRRDSDKKHR